MKCFKSLLYISLFALLLCNTSCELKNDLKGQIIVPSAPGGELPLDSVGMLDLTLKPYKEAVPPASKAISGSDVIVLDVNDFSVDILNAAGELIKHYDTYEKMKNDGALLLPSGQYSIVAQLGELVEAGFDVPFYEGTSVCKINPKEVAKVIADCTLANKKIVFKCSDDFLDKFEDDYSIMLTNGKGVLTAYNGDDRVAYFKNSDKLDLIIYAADKGGKDYVFRKALMEDDLISKYNNIHITLEPDSMFTVVEPKPDPDPEDPDNPGTTPSDTLWTPTIKIDITLVNNEQIIVVPSGTIEPDDPDKPSTGNTPTIKGKGFDIKKRQTVTESSKIAVMLTMPEGLKELKVKVRMTGLGDKDLNFDMLNLSEDDKNGIFKGVVLPKLGQTSYTFDISGFMGMMSILPGKHEFTIMLTDKSNQKATETLMLEMTNNKNYR